MTATKDDIKVVVAEEAVTKTAAVVAVAVGAEVAVEVVTILVTTLMKNGAL
jgi:hypothetical protein